MSVGTGKVFSIIKETTYGTYLAPTQFIELNTESITANSQPYEAFGLTGGRFLRSNRVRQIMKGASGDTEFDVTIKAMGKLFQAMLGDVATTQPDNVGEPLHYLHTFTPDSAGLRGVSYSVQKNIPTEDDTDAPFSYSGGKVASWRLTAALDTALKLALTWDFAQEYTDKAVGVPSFAADNLAFIDIDLAIKIDGAASCIKGLTIEGNNALSLDRWCLGGTKREPLPNGEATITGTIDKDFENLTLYNKFVNGTHAALILTASYGEIDSGQADPFQLVVTVPDIYFTGTTPTINGPDLVQQSLPFKALDNGTDPIIQFEYHSSDATP